MIFGGKNTERDFDFEKQPKAIIKNRFYFAAKKYIYYYTILCKDLMKLARDFPQNFIFPSSK